MGKIITFTGVSGAGKSTIAKSVGFPFVPSTTTREPRPSDLPGEYEYLEHGDFDHDKAWDAFLWVNEYDGNSYGTKSEMVDTALTNPGTYTMILVPRVLPLLLKYAGTDKVLPFYILSPPEEILRSRMEQRGNTPDSIERRLKETKNWDEQAGKAAIPYFFITNDGTIDEAVEQVKKYLK
ncbi:MAG: hypothetical protein Q7S55_01205 [Nanoarchaeota archaeon]|nr:hypothetical protein [Nanoarchaeota archaeon]